MRRTFILLPVLLALQVGVQPALAWTWPVDGPVLRQFDFGSNPYAAGQHRGIDIGAAGGAPVRAPASGRVSFAGTVPGGGRALTIETAEGFSVTLVHLGAIGMARGAAVGEGTAVGTVGPSGDAELPEPYVYLGIRMTADPNGYLDPLRFLPPRADPVPEPSSQPTAEPAPAPAPADEHPAPSRHGRVNAGERTGPLLHPTAAAGAKSAAPRERARRLRLHTRSDQAGRDVRGQHASARGANTPVADERAVHDRAFGTALSSPASRALVSRARTPEAEGRGTNSFWSLAPAAVLVVGAVGLRLRRKLRDARAADRAPAMLLEGALPSAEDTGALRLGEEDHLVLDRDLERVLFAQPEPLPDLDRNHDPAQLVDVPDDPRSCYSARGPRRRSNGLSRTHPLRPCPSMRLSA